MLKYFIKISFILLSINLSAQQDSLQTSLDSLVPHKRQPVKIRIGFDAGKYIWARLNDSESYDFYIDANFYKNYYLIFLTGYENHLTNSSLLTYHTTGNYYKLGIDYNIYENWLDMDNDITIGVRYAYAGFDYQLNSFRINQPEAVITPEINEVNKYFTNLSAHWLDFTAKIQAETFKNVYLGYAVSLKYLMSYSDPDDFEVLYIPGFFERNSYSNFGFGMQYFISYRFKF